MRPRALAAAVLVTGALAATAPVPSTRVEELREEIARLRADAARLEGQERGLLGEIARMDGAIALRRAELLQARFLLEANESALAERERSRDALDAAQARRKPQLVKSLRALYTRGDVGLLRDVLDTVQGAGRRDGIRYAELLARRDASRIEAWRGASARLSAERGALDEERRTLAASRDDALRASSTLEASRAERAAVVERIRSDRARHEQAIAELESAAAGLNRVVPGAPEPSAPGALDVRTFRGLLDWPAEGEVSAGFGPMVHPRFKTTVPHPGWDIEAPEGSPFRSMFDGRVAFAAPLHGYGLTVVIDHGQGVASVYAHAGALLVAAGDPVARGQELGRVGDSGSLRGPYLYFEVREAGKPSDPGRWLRPH